MSVCCTAGPLAQTMNGRIKFGDYKALLVTSRTCENCQRDSHDCHNSVTVMTVTTAWQSWLSHCHWAFLRPETSDNNNIHQIMQKMLCFKRFSHNLFYHEPINKSLLITTDVCTCADLWIRFFASPIIAGGTVLVLYCNSCGIFWRPQTYQVSRISRETTAFWSNLPLIRRVTKISRISVLSTNKILVNQRVIRK